MDERTRSDDAPSQGRARRMKLLGPAAALLAAAALAVGSFTIATRRNQAAAVLDSAQAQVLSRGATISVTGAGTVQGTPNEVSFGIGVETRAATATSALDENNADISTLETTLEREGVKPSEMQTSSLDLYDDTNSSGDVTGFTVDDDLNVNRTNVARAGGAIDSAAQAVGDGIQLQGISFSISNQSALLARARAVAMANARTEAEQVAAGAGLSLGPIVRVTDEENGGSPIVPAGELAASLPTAVSLQGGRQPVTVQVRVVYELRS